MSVTYRLTPELRRRLKKPFGMLVRGTYKETMKKFKDIIEKEEPPMIISVGDTVSKNLVKNRIIPQLSIVDNKVMRKSIQPVVIPADKHLMVKNPPGTITKKAFKAIQEALKNPHRCKIVVEGEEDLLTLAAVLHAPENSMIVYGQPYEGIVIVKATNQKKNEIVKILKAMEDTRKTK